MSPVLLVLAKAPIAGFAKTRLAADLGDPDLAADLAATALLDTVEACAAAVGAGSCVLALEGDLRRGARAEQLASALTGWRIVPQSGGGLAERLVHAHDAVQGPRLQIGMDTPQVTATQLRSLADRLVSHDAVLAPAQDGGWWALGLRDGADASALVGVPMSQPTTYLATLAALQRAGLRVTGGPVLTDVDHAVDAARVARSDPESRFGRRWSEVTR